ncbi:hypothetical protein Tco_0508631 [Tanacetum coccineum]
MRATSASHKTDIRKTILGLTGIFQVAKLRKIADIREGGEEFMMLTHKYIRKVVDDVGEDGDFTVGTWVRADEFVIAITKSCIANALDDLRVTLKDLLGTLSGTTHYKVLAKGGYGNDITLGAVLILHNVSVFTLKPSVHYINLQQETWLRFLTRIQLLEMVVM